MHILVLQHARAEHPGIFRQFLKEDGNTWETVELDEGEALPDIDKFYASRQPLRKRRVKHIGIF